MIFEEIVAYTSFVVVIDFFKNNNRPIFIFLALKDDMMICCFTLAFGLHLYCALF